MIPWIVYGAVLAVSLSANVVGWIGLWSIRRSLKKDPAYVLKRLLEGAGIPAQDRAIVFDHRGECRIMSTVADCGSHEPLFFTRGSE